MAQVPGVGLSLGRWVQVRRSPTLRSSETNTNQLPRWPAHCTPLLWGSGEAGGFPCSSFHQQDALHLPPPFVGPEQSQAGTKGLMSAAHEGKESGWLASPAAGLDGVAGQVSRKFHADPVGNPCSGNFRSPTTGC